MLGGFGQPSLEGAGGIFAGHTVSVATRNAPQDIVC